MVEKRRLRRRHPRVEGDHRSMSEGMLAPTSGHPGGREAAGGVNLLGASFDARWLRLTPVSTIAMATPAPLSPAAELVHAEQAGDIGGGALWRIAETDQRRLDERIGEHTGDLGSSAQGGVQAGSSPGISPRTT